MDGGDVSKSQARAFFLGGTALCAVAFIGLTLDTFRRIPDQTKNANITKEVEHGKQLWESNNCMGCHTLFGEGAYYAPELTKVYDRRGEQFIRSMLTNPEKMYPGQRKMQKYEFTEEDKTALILHRLKFSNLLIQCRHFDKSCKDQVLS